MTYLPSIKKFPGKLDSLKLLYVKSKTSSTAKAPKPLGNESKRFILNNVDSHILYNVLFRIQ